MKSQFRWALGPALGALVICLLMVPASAAPVEGFIGFTGPGVLAFSLSSGAPGDNYVDWCPTNLASGETGSGCGIDNSGTGETTVGSVGPVGGDFSVNLGGTGTILDITDNPAAPPYTFVPLGPTSVPNFLTFSGENWDYTLTEIVTQSCSGAFQFCTPYFKLDQGSAQSATTTVSLAGLGTVTRMGEVSTFDLLITGNFNADIAGVIAGATSSEGIFSPSWSGTLFATAAPIPEPGTTAMLLLGIAGLGVGAFRRRKV